MKKTIIAALAAVSISTASAQLAVSKYNGGLACKNLTDLEGILYLYIAGDYGYVKKEVNRLKGEGECVIVNKGIPFFTTEIHNQYYTVIHFDGYDDNYWVRNAIIKLITKKTK